jgi:hypothetical protein
MNDHTTTGAPHTLAPVPMTSTDLAHALAIPLNAPGCWAARAASASTNNTTARGA